MKIKRDRSFNARYLICSDLQVPFQFDAAISNLKTLVKAFKFDLVLNVGDELDLNKSQNTVRVKLSHFNRP